MTYDSSYAISFPLEMYLPNVKEIVGILIVSFHQITRDAISHSIPETSLSHISNLQYTYCHLSVWENTFRLWNLVIRITILQYFDMHFTPTFIFFNWTRIAQMVKRQATDLDIRGSNSGPGSNFLLKPKHCNFSRHKLKVRFHLSI